MVIQEATKLRIFLTAPDCLLPNQVRERIVHCSPSSICLPFRITSQSSQTPRESLRIAKGDSFNKMSVTMSSNPSTINYKRFAGFSDLPLGTANNLGMMRSQLTGA